MSVDLKMNNFKIKISHLYSKLSASDNFKSFVIYGFSNVLVGLSPLIMTPILTRYLTKEEFGTYFLFLSAFNMLTIILSINAHVSITVNFNKLSNSEFKVFYSSVLTLPLTILIALSSLILICYYMEVFEKDSLYLIVFCLLSAFFNAYVLYALAYFQISLKPKFFFFTRLFQTICDIGMVFALIAIFTDSFKARIESHFLTMLLLSMICIFFTFRIGLLVKNFDKAYVKKAVFFGLPLIPHTLAGLIIMNTDRFFLKEIIDVSSSGLFSSVIVIASLMMLYIEPVNKVFAPWLLSKLASKANDIEKINIVRVTYSLSLSFFVFAFFLYLSQDILYYLFVDPSYYLTKDIFLIVLIGFCFQGMYYLVTNYLLHSESGKTLASITVLVSIVGAAFSYSLISVLGFNGAAYSFMLTNMLLFLFVWCFASKAVKMPWFSFKRILN